MDFVRKRHGTCANMLKILGRDKSDQIYGAVLYTINGTCQVRRLAILPDPIYRRHGLGTFLMNAALIGKRCPLRCETFTARVREVNFIGQAFLKSLGFVFDQQESRTCYDEDLEWYVFRFHKPAHKRLFLALAG